jgi:hypothetical protein
MSQRVWVVLVTDGTVLESAPELYVDRHLAMRFADNWAWFLSARGEFRVDRPFEDLIRVGQWDIRVIETALPANRREFWVGMHWTEDGYPDPEAVVFGDRESAVGWATAPISGIIPTELQQSVWHAAAKFSRRSSEVAHSVVYLAKAVGVPLN